MKMRLIGVFLFTVLLMAFGCGGESSQQDGKGLHGSWNIDIDDTINASPELKTQIDANPMAKDMLKAMLGDFNITFDTEKGVFSGKMAGTDLGEQKFTISSQDGDKITIKADDDTEMDFRLADENTLEIRDPQQGMLLIFKRVQ